MRQRRWKDMGRAEKYALIQTQVLYWALTAVAIYLIASMFSVAAALAIVGFLVVAWGLILAKIRRDRREDG